MSSVRFVCVLFMSVWVSAVPAQSIGLDSTFGSSGHFATTLGGESFAVRVQLDGKILAGGVKHVGGELWGFLIRYLPDGSVDGSFGSSGSIDIPSGGDGCVIRDFVLRDDGGIICVGMFNRDLFLVAFTSEGLPDIGFGQGGTQVWDHLGGIEEGRAISLLSDGRVLVGGYADVGSERHPALWQFLADGSFDTTFGVQGISILNTGMYSDGLAMALRPDGHILLAGSGIANAITHMVLQCDENGTLDTAFGTNGLTTLTNPSGGGFVGSVLLQDDGKLVMIGPLTVGSVSRPTITRLLADGSLDLSFGTGGSAVLYDDVFNPYSFRGALLTDGRIIIAGFGSPGVHFMCALDASGLVDTSFAVNGWIWSDVVPGLETITAMTLDDEGRLILAGGSSEGCLVTRYVWGSDIGIATRHYLNATISPNPVSDEIHITLTNSLSEVRTIELFDATGHIARRFLPHGTQRESHDLTGLAAGMYSLVLRNNEGAVSIQVVKQ